MNNNSREMTTTATGVTSNKIVGGAKPFQYYLDNFFEIPKEMKNDIIYCQRALKAHIKVQDMVHDMFKVQANSDTARKHKRRIFAELKAEIFEINAEQQFLFIRLNGLIDEFNKILKRKDIPMDRSAINALVSSEVVPSINDVNLVIMPLTVSLRQTEAELIEKYLVQRQEPKDKLMTKQDDEQLQVVEITDSDDDVDNHISKVVVGNVEKTKKTDVKTLNVVAKVDLTGDDVPQLPNGSGFGGKKACSSGHNVMQMSLLKPITQRLVEGQTAIIDAGADAVEKNVEKATIQNIDLSATESYGSKSNGFKPVAGDKGTEEEKPTFIELPVSKKVEMSRMNLRQALKKARTDQVAALAAAATVNVAAAVPPNKAPVRKTPSSSSSTTAGSKGVTLVPNKRVSGKPKNARAVAAALAPAVASKATEVNTSSDDSNAEGEAISASAILPDEPVDKRTLPEHYGKDMFLGMFNLYPLEKHQQMQQRRSKRKRRTVHSNERADFHYGRIEYGSVPPPNASNRGQRSNHPKRRTAEKTDKITPPSRSRSSSPVEKRSCNECLKDDGNLGQCQGCKAYYHQMCHREQDKEKEKKLVTAKHIAVQSDKLKLCPTCKRAH